MGDGLFESFGMFVLDVFVGDLVFDHNFYVLGYEVVRVVVLFGLELCFVLFGIGYGVIYVDDFGVCIEC
jgi:hypothetical protein